MAARMLANICVQSTENSTRAAGCGKSKSCDVEGDNGCSQTSVRFASKSSGGTSKNKRKRTHRKFMGFKVKEGDFVQTGTILCTQLQLRFYPGENVSIGHNMTLNAMEDGEVMLTKETLNPYPDSPIYPGVKNGDIIERVFFHVIPKPQHNNFKLVSLV